MTYRSTRLAALLALPLGLALLSGCVERTMVITTEPYGAVVYDERMSPLSGSPADKSFIYYGKYRFTIVKDGYETLVKEEDVTAPWYEWLGLDFISENLVPWTIRDVHRYHYKLETMKVIPLDLVLEQATPLRIKGKGVGEPLPPGPVGQPAPHAEPPGILSNPGFPVVPPAAAKTQ